MIQRQIFHFLLTLGQREPGLCEKRSLSASSCVIHSSTDSWSFSSLGTERFLSYVADVGVFAFLKAFVFTILKVM